jgi:hypothetical protein
VDAFVYFIYVVVVAFTCGCMVSLAIGNPCSEKLIFKTGARSEVILVVLVSSLTSSDFRSE